MDARLRRIAEQLTEQTELHNSSAQRAQLAGQQVQELRERVQALEEELLSADVHQEKLLQSQQHVRQVVRRLRWPGGPRLQWDVRNVTSSLTFCFGF